LERSHECTARSPRTNDQGGPPWKIGFFGNPIFCGAGKLAKGACEKGTKRGTTRVDEKPTSFAEQGVASFAEMFACHRCGAWRNRYATHKPADAPHHQEAHMSKPETLPVLNLDMIIPLDLVFGTFIRMKYAEAEHLQAFIGVCEAGAFLRNDPDLPRKMRVLRRYIEVLHSDSIAHHRR
jgi:hypothetical protein